MILNYDFREIEEKAKNLNQGYISYTTDQNNVIIFKDVLSDFNDSDKLLLFKKRNRQIYIGAESFLFQEGKAEHFGKAKYAELKITQEGKVLLVGLRDEQFNNL